MQFILHIAVINVGVSTNIARASPQRNSYCKQTKSQQITSPKEDKMSWDTGKIGRIKCKNC